MSADNGKDIIIGESPVHPEPEKKKDVTLSITVRAETGQLEVQGPGDGKMFDKMICFHLMEEAKDYIKFHNLKANEKKIIPANPTMAEQVRRMWKK